MCRTPSESHNDMLNMNVKCLFALLEMMCTQMRRCVWMEPNKGLFLAFLSLPFIFCWCHDKTDEELWKTEPFLIISYLLCWHLPSFTPLSESKNGRSLCAAVTMFFSMNESNCISSLLNIRCQSLTWITLISYSAHPHTILLGHLVSYSASTGKKKKKVNQVQSLKENTQ